MIACSNSYIVLVNNLENIIYLFIDGFAACFSIITLSLRPPNQKRVPLTSSYMYVFGTNFHTEGFATNSRHLFISGPCNLRFHLTDYAGVDVWSVAALDVAIDAELERRE